MLLGIGSNGGLLWTWLKLSASINSTEFLEKLDNYQLLKPNRAGFPCKELVPYGIKLAAHVVMYALPSSNKSVKLSYSPLVAKHEMSGNKQFWTSSCFQVERLQVIASQWKDCKFSSLSVTSKSRFIKYKYRFTLSMMLCLSSVWYNCLFRTLNIVGHSYLLPYPNGSTFAKERKNRFTFSALIHFLIQLWYIVVEWRDVSMLFA